MKRNKISSAPLRGFVNNSVNDGNEKRAETAERRIRSARFFLSRSCLFSHLPERPSLFHFYFYNYFFFFLFFFAYFLRILFCLRLLNLSRVAADGVAQSRQSVKGGGS